MAEFDWIEKYLRPLASSTNAMGLLDDVALLSDSGERPPHVVTMDTLVEGVHFLASDPPGSIGRKLARVNISDVICKGALPRQALLSLARPDHFSEAAFEAFCVGLNSDLEQWGIDLLGGDLVSTPGPLVLTLVLTGECAGPNPVKRSGASPGDRLYVTGMIGAGLTGLEHARARIGGPVAEHYREPKLPAPDIARLVAKFASASIDVSDGLIADARHISEASATGIRVDLEQVPWVEETGHIERLLALAAGGDDYQTLFTVSPALEPDFIETARQSNSSVKRIGEVLEDGGLTLFWHGGEVPIPAKSGYQH